MTYAGKNFMEEVECVCLEFSIWIETDNMYLKDVTLGFGSRWEPEKCVDGDNKHSKNSILGLSNIPESGRINRFIRDSTYHVPETKLSGGDRRRKYISFEFFEDRKYILFALDSRS